MEDIWGECPYDKRGSMRLRNKKTGQEGNFIINKDHFECVDLDCVPLYFSLSELLDEWEDYTPKEPLIKDEKIRKAVRAWAEANEIETVEYDEYWVSFRRDDKTIGFKDEYSRLGFYKLENSRDYTIDELCGEEEE